MQFAPNNEISAKISEDPSGPATPYFLPEDVNAPDYSEHIAEVCHDLRESQERIFLLAVHDHLSIDEIAAAERVSSSAIKNRFRRMGRKNPYVQMWRKHQSDTRRDAIAQVTTTTFRRSSRLGNEGE
jgi:DNA-directed RNA polymerase specialized sigma24 family protein